MRKNIMLLFLSSLRTIPKEGKNYIGYGLQGNCIGTVPGIQTNEAPVKYVIKCLKNEGGLDAVYYFRTKKVQQNIEGHEISSEDFFKQQISHYCNETGYKVPKLIDVEFKEDLEDESTVNASKDQVHMALSSAFNMLDKVKEYDCIDNMNVYVDITGGFRYSTMLLVAVMRLLQYSGIQMKQVIYSDMDNKTIVDVTQLYKLYDVISGANEFAEFGRVDTLQNYYNRKNKGESSILLKNLLKQMNQFSENLQLCKAKGFKSDLGKLQQAIEAFKKSAISSDDENLFGILLMRVEEEYREIIQKDASEPVIIKWCAKKGFIQQALTLYVELIPEYLVRNKLIYPINVEHTKDHIKKQLRKETKKYIEWEKQFILNTKYSLDHMEGNSIGAKSSTETFLKIGGVGVKEGKVEVIKSVLKNYDDIRDKRNHTHHANAQYVVQTLEGVKKQIIEHMDMIIQLEQA